MSLLAEVVRFLEEQQVPHALIGAGAMAIRGFSRGTADSDLLTLDASLLKSERRESLTAGASLEIFKGDFGESLEGTIRLKAGPEVVDVVVGHDVWQRDLIAGADRMAVGDVTLPVVRAAGLGLLKLLTSSSERVHLCAEVERTLPRLPEEARRLWTRILSGSTPAA